MKYKPMAPQIAFITTIGYLQEVLFKFPTIKRTHKGLVRFCQCQATAYKQFYIKISTKKIMKRVAFKMKLKEGQKEEYKKRHKALWPELRELLNSAGVSEYSIFFDTETHTLFAFQKVSGKGDSQDLAIHPIVQKWWAYMADIMEVREDNSPISIPLEEVFYME